MAKITRNVVSTTQPGDRDQFIWDGDVKGFGLKVTPSGRKIFVLSYRFAGKPTRITLGDSSILDLEEARRDAKRKLVALLDGKDPLAIREAERAREDELTVGELIDKWQKEAVPKKARAPGSLQGIGVKCRGVKSAPFAGDKLSTLTRRSLNAWHSAMSGWNPQTKRFDGAPIQANINLKHLKHIWIWASRNRYLPAVAYNPASESYVENLFGGFELNEKTQRAKPSLKLDDNARLLRALVEMQAEGRVNRVALGLIRLFHLTAVRPGHLAELKWEDDGTPLCNWVDHELGLLILNNHKTRRWTNREMTYPITAQVAAILGHLRAVQVGSPWVFPATHRARGGKLSFKLDKHAHTNSIDKTWWKVLKRAGVKRFRFYDLRGIAESFQESRIGEKAAAAIQGHSVDVARKHYFSTDEEKRRTDIERINSEYIRALTGAPTKQTA